MSGGGGAGLGREGYERRESGVETELNNSNNNKAKTKHIVSTSI
jgi:hypothetical protein